jgi:hypothetical protein
MIERGDEPGDVVGIGDVIRFYTGKRLLRGRVRIATEFTITVETKSGRLYGVFRNDVNEIENMCHIVPCSL